MSKQEVILCESLETSLGRAIELCPHDKLFVLTDEHTQRLCLPSLKESGLLKDAVEICIGAEDVHKTLETLASVWMALSTQGATRHSLLINLGGGMVTDLGGFAAATFKRGISYINIPTTLLAMVDASVGGKTGINFNGLKNEIGAFAPANSVLIETEFLRTLDPFEHGIRKALNLGHTVGHAFESMALAENRPVLHGYAVAWGIVCELYLSHLKVGFPKEKMRQTIQFIKDNYGVFTFDCKKYDQLYAFMTHDKKNTSGTINFTLLKDIGDICINQTADKDTIFEMLDFYRECMGI